MRSLEFRVSRISGAKASEFDLCHAQNFSVFQKKGVPVNAPHAGAARDCLMFGQIFMYT